MAITRRFWLGAALAALLPLGSTAASAQAAAVGVGAAPVVFAAASLKNAMDDAAGLWASYSYAAPKLSFAASNALEQQIAAGAPADLFFSADTDWMDAAQKAGLIKDGTRVDLLGNEIVLVAPKDSTVKVDIRQGFDLAGALKGGRLAMGNVDAVPAGKYGKAALQKLGAWDGVRDHIAQAESVRAALAFVARGEAPLGVVYATDAAAEPKVRIVGTFPADSHPPIVYPVALTKDSQSPQASQFLLFLRGEKAAGIFKAQGFTTLQKPVPQQW
ncbi:molybdate ABC transporter substrate-binding protein [Lichenibacterium dinghuense]|uniref:molybdate ABC transporter substrate-binding protein n=1 Tax=Lichenibacterium dinghuense TaxID=2895977 RepID=UPI001F030A23|nr:molybdate ABC transporter substrate-binding protein [Lichenibacterium sp. 6Y81]